MPFWARRLPLLGGLVGGLALLLAAQGCGGAPPGRQCMTMGGASDLVAGAAVLRVDVYAATVACDGNRAQAGAQPALSQMFEKGQPISLDLSPGMHTVVLTAFADAGASMPIGAACTQADFQPGQSVCLDLTISPVPDAAAPQPDLSVCQGATCPCSLDGDCRVPSLPRCSPDTHLCVPCLPTNDNCAAGSYCGSGNQCVPGCKLDSDCASNAGGDDGGASDGGTAPARTLCDTTRHGCVECRGPEDCAVGKLCSPAGNCVDGCDLTKGKGCAPGLTCCGNLCLDTRSDPFNCNGCNQPCTGAQKLCCNGSCVDPLTDAKNCNGCGKACSTLNDTPSCSLGVCGFSCGAGFQHCQQGNTGCETSTASTTNCSGCNLACDTTTAQSATCNGTTCSYACNAGRADCIKIGANTDGCETNIAGDPAHCGSCTLDCGAQEKNASGLLCAAGKCDYTACSSAQYGDCDGVRSNGCEANLNTDVMNCGACGNNCLATVKNATGVVCNAGKCDYTSCSAANFGDCDGIRSNGCEVDLNTNTAHCGSCAINCGTTVANATGVACNGAGKCTYASCSAANFADCNLDKTDGCEVNLNTDAGHCGACGTNCNNTVANATGISCNGSGSCTYASCSAANFSDCDGIRSNGCEINTNTDPSHCGNCGTNCSVTVLNANGKTCNGSGACTYSSCSASNFADCDGIRSNGCEVDLNTNTSHCGACSTDCNTQVQNASGKACSGAACTYASCNGGFGSCDSIATNGCETPTTTTSNCSGCGLVCDSSRSLSPSCNGTTCSYGGCNAGYIDCNTTAPNTNGCECQTDPANPACCGGGSTSTCQTKHSNGVGQNFWDCLPLGMPGVASTYSQTLANEAANSATGLPGVNQGVFVCGTGGTMVSVICRTADSTGMTGPCTCWAYASGGAATTAIGHFNQSANGCFCPNSTFGTWN